MPDKSTKSSNPHLSGNTIQNFGRNLSFQPAQFHEPASEDDVMKVLASSNGKRIRVSGSLHCWSKAVFADEILISMRNMKSIEIKSLKGEDYVTAGGGCQISDLLKELKKRGLTLPSVGLIDKQSVAGATATGTHGSGKHSLSHYIESARIAHFDKDGIPIITEINTGPELKAARCSLGLLGVVLSVTFKCRPCYNIKEHVAKYESLKKVIDLESRYPLQQFYLMPWSWAYFGHHRVESNEPKSKSANWYHIYWFSVVDIALHAVVFTLAKVLTLNWLIKFFFKRVIGLTIARNWKVVDDSHKLLTMEHDLFRHIEIELFVTRSNLAPAIEHVIDAISVFGGQPVLHGNKTLAKELEPFYRTYCHHYPICVRRVLTDDTLISMTSPTSGSNQEDWYAISLISYHWPSQREGFFKFANFLGTSMLEKFSARCHWGKFNPLSKTQNEKLYPQLPEFDLIRRKFDPSGKFKNDWLDQVITFNTSSHQAVR